ncbi:MAG: hypothetical protein J6J44_11180 [Lachnospiraceae bacterium]|nr:hypothetical protein [Lachnospiraceae bacterium]
MKKRVFWVLFGVAAMALSGCGVAQVESAANMLVDSAEKVAGLASSSDGKSSAVERWAGNLAGSVANFEVEADLDIDKIYSDIETAITEQLEDKLLQEVQNMVNEELKEVGMTVEIKEDGSWEVEAKEGEIEELDGDWPENEFTKQVPKPSFDATAANTQEKSFSVAFVDTNVDDIRAYVEELKNAGFTVNATNKDVEVFGVVAYSYKASNGAGYSVEVTFAEKMCGLTITKN